MDIPIQELKDIKHAVDIASIIAITDARGVITYVNDTFCNISGYSREELLGNTHRILNSGFHPKDFFKHMWETIQSGQVWKGEIKNKSKNGGYYWVDTTIIPFVDDHGKPTQYISIRIEITERKLAEENISRLAYFDRLTGLANQNELRNHLEQLIDQAETQIASVLFIDMDRFKVINQTYGHTAGNQLLHDTAVRLRQCIDDNTFLARFAGDQFMIVASHSAEAAAHLAQTILDHFKTPFVANQQEVTLSLNIGISVYPDNARDAETLIKHAGIALFAAKQKGKNTFQFLTETLRHHHLRNLKLEQDLRHAIHNGELSLYYQPQVDLQSNAIVGMEALVRWNHPELGAVAPSEFIPLAEQSGLIIDMGKWVLKTACRQNKAWQLQGLPPLKMAVNVSVQELQHEGFIPHLTAVLEETQLDPVYLELEITESIMQDPEVMPVLLRKLKDIGVWLSIDDFGTGFSSLSLLHSLPVDIVKIDQSFVKKIQSDPNALSLITSIIQMAKNFDFVIIAEGVEMHEQAQFLHEHRCNIGQGYLFGRPLPAPEAINVLEAAHTDPRSI